MIRLNYIYISNASYYYETALLKMKFNEGGLKPEPSVVVFNRTKYEALNTTYGHTPVLGDFVWSTIKDTNGTVRSLANGFISNIQYNQYDVEVEFSPVAKSKYAEECNRSWTSAKLGCDAIDYLGNVSSAHTHHTTKSVNKYNGLGKRFGTCIRDVIAICLGASSSITDWANCTSSGGAYVWPETFKAGNMMSPAYVPDRGTISQSSSTAKLISAEWTDPSNYNVKTVSLTYNGGSATASQSSSAVAGTLSVLNKSISDSTDATNYVNGMIKVYDVSRKIVKVRCIITDVDNAPRENDYYDVTDAASGKSATDLGVINYTYEYPANIFTITLCDVPLLPEEFGQSTTDRVNVLEKTESNPIERVASKLTLDNTVDCVLTADASGGLLINGVLITGTGDVIKSGSSAANQIPKWVGTGYTLAASGITIDSSNNLAGIGSIGHEGHITPGSTNTWDLGSSSKIYNEAFIGNPYMTSFRSLDTSSLDATVQFAQNGTNNAWLRFRLSGSSQEAGVLWSNYDSGHFFECASGANIVWKYNTSIDYAASTQIMNLTSGGILTVNGVDLEGGTYDCGLTSNTTGQLLIEGQYGTTTIGMGNASYTHFQTDGTTGFAFNKHIILYNSNTYDIGSTAPYYVRNLYMGTGIYMNGTQFIDSSRNLSNIGTLECTAIGINETPIANKACFDLSASSYGNMQLGNPSAGESSICYIGNATTYGSSPASSSGNTYIWVAGHGCWTNNGKYVIGSVGRTGSAGPVLILDTNGLLDLPVIGTTSSQGIKIGGDVNLYRSAANVLKTDDSFTCASATVGSTAIPAASPIGQFLRDDCTWQTCSGSGTLTGPASSTANALVKWSNTGGIQTLNSIVLLDTSKLYPASANSYDLGSTSYEWRTLYLGTYLYLGTSQQGRLGMNTDGAIETPDDFVARLGAFDYVYSGGSVTASSTSQMAYPSSVNTSSLTMVAVARITASVAVTGTVRVYCTFYNESSLQVAYARIYKNGVAQGTEQSTDDTPATFYISLTNIAAGDYYQLYMRTSDAGYLAYCSSFYVGYTLPTKPTALFTTASS